MEHFKSVKDFAELCGVSVRTLHHYHANALLVPEKVDPETGYRYYGEESLRRMQQILFWRELGFPLAEIRDLLAFGAGEEALAAQEQLLEAKKRRLQRMIDAIRKLRKGENIDMSSFDTKELDALKEKYAAEAKERWGGTAEYAECERRAAARDAEGSSAMEAEMEAIFRGFAALAAEGADPAGEAARELVRAWQAHITKHHYPCSEQILKSLGLMYTADERFKGNLDSYGDGTAEFMSAAIAAL